MNRRAVEMLDLFEKRVPVRVIAGRFNVTYPEALGAIAEAQTIPPATRHVILENARAVWRSLTLVR